MKLIIIALLISSFTITVNLSTANAGSCDYSYQKAKNGSACGARAKSARKASSYAK
jgi:hypothetical protein